MNRFLNKVVVFGLLITAFASCDNRSEYEKLVAQEMRSGIRKDSLFLGIHLGMTRKDFYVHCWQLNKQYLLDNGPGNLSAEYQVKDELRMPSFMRFYPNFVDNKIYEMPVEFTYQNWSPWAKETSGDSLLPDVLKMYEQWYGKKFLKMEREDKEDSWVMIDANKRLIVFRKDTSTVYVRYDDLLVTNQLEKQKREMLEDL